MKKFFGVIMLLLAMNFLAVAGGVGWLFNSGHLDKARIGKIREVLFPPPPAPSTRPATDGATTRPTMKLDELLAKQSGHTAAEQVEFIQKTFDSRMFQLDLRERGIDDREKQIDLATQKLASDREALDKERKALAAQQAEATKLQTDKGFQDSLTLYNSMDAKQVKQIFLTLSETTVEQYLEAMEPRAASKIIKEFKTPDETALIQRILERMRRAQSAATTTETPK